MSLFKGGSKNSFLGIDIGAGGIKVVEMKSEKGRSRVLTYGYSKRDLQDYNTPLIDNPKVAADLLTKIIKSSGAKATQAVSALPISKVFSTAISVPRAKDEKELKPMVEMQARKLLPMPLEEMILDSKLIDPLRAEKPTEPKGNVRVLITGAAKTLVQKYVEIFKLAKFDLTALETESFALIRSLIGKDKASILIIDLGSIRTNLTIVEKGIPFLNRSINIGGVMVTKQIAKQMNMSDVEAEQLKYDLASQHHGGDMIPAVEQVMQPIINEINYSFEQYARMETSQMNRPDKIILTGGSAHLPGLAEYIANKIGINTYTGDPWARVAYPDDLRLVLDDIGPGLAVAIGLGMRDLD